MSHQALIKDCNFIAIINYDLARKYNNQGEIPTFSLKKKRC